MPDDRDNNQEHDNNYDYNSFPIVRFSEFLGIGYFGDAMQQVISPIFDFQRNAENAWLKVMEDQDGNKQGVATTQGAVEAPPPAPILLHAVFIEHPSKYEFLAYPAKIKPDQINYVLYRSFSSLGNFHKFKNNMGQRIFIKFGWHDITKGPKFDVMKKYALVDSVEFKKPEEIKEGSLIDRIRKNQ